MAVFENLSVLMELKNVSFKEKKKLKSAVTENGGNICFVVNKQCSLIVTSDVSDLSSNRLRSIQKHRTPVVGGDYVYSCLERGVRLPVDAYKLDTPPSSAVSAPPPLSSPRPASPAQQVTKISTSKSVPEPPTCQAEPAPTVSLSQKAKSPDRSGGVLEKFRIYTETDSDLPPYPDHFQVAKYSIFEKTNCNTWCVLELQSFKGKKARQYRVVRYWKDGAGVKKATARDMLVFPSTSEEAVQVYQTLRDTLEASGLQKRSSIPTQDQDLGSAPLQQLLLEEKLNTGSLSQEVGVFVELLWTEALGCLGNILRVSIDKLSLNDVSRAEGLLLQAQKKLSENLPEVASLLDEVYTLLPHREPQVPPNAKLISQKLDLCQLIRDVLNVSETTLRSPVPSSLGKYRALRCSIETVPPSSSEFQAVTALLQNSTVQIQQILRVSRGVELQTFRSELSNIKQLLHSSGPNNFVGILSRGLLLPRVGVEHHGIERTDVGNLGSGIYFSNAVSTCLKYSKPSVTDGSRLLLVCDVALGQCKDVRKRDLTLTQAPKGHHSVHGIRRTDSAQSEFVDDEYVVYSPDQVKLKYVIQFSGEGDQLKDFSPAVNTSAEPCLPSSDQELGLEGDGVENIRNPLENVTAGLLDNSGQQLPLQAVHVKCKLMDLLSQVIIFQKYTNLSSEPIEAKYVFPLDDSAAVCGFEAFINGKHVVGQVKEKETARKEYKQAIEKGHGAYLMDQDAPDVFTISVGNLPPGATVLIKVTFVSELIVRDGSILFSLPGSVAPWQERAALNQTTQVTVEKVCVTDEAASTREFTLDMSVEMPHEISSLQCTTHKVKIKRTDCKAVVSVLPGEVMGPEGFQLSVSLSEVHLPRMWVEKHPDKDSQACMLVFYPDFDVGSTSAADEVVLLVDTSESMKGESLRVAQRVALQLLKDLDHNVRLNVILFGTDHTEAFPTPRPLAEVRQAAESFIKRSSSVGGSTELWRPLRALSLLPPSSGVRNLLLLSDGHIQNAEVTLKLLRDNARHSRLFTCGLSPTANRHMLRALAQAGGGAYEFFDTKTKHNWAEKVARQVKRMASPGCSSVSVKWQQFNPTAPPPVQAPKLLHALFNDCHTLVYGFVPHCTQATLLGELGGQELKTMVSTSELQKTRGTFLHKLTARALIRDYEDGSLDRSEAEHEGKKAELKSFIVELSKEFSILSQFTSFVAIEERDSEQAEDGFTDIPKLIAEDDVDFLSYISWISPASSCDLEAMPKRSKAVDLEEETSSSEMSLVEDYCGAAGPSSNSITDDDSSVETNLLFEQRSADDGALMEEAVEDSPQYSPTSSKLSRMKVCRRESKFTAIPASLEPMEDDLSEASRSPPLQRHSEVLAALPTSLPSIVPVCPPPPPPPQYQRRGKPVIAAALSTSRPRFAAACPPPPPSPQQRHPLHGQTQLLSYEVPPPPGLSFSPTSYVPPVLACVVPPPVHGLGGKREAVTLKRRKDSGLAFAKSTSLSGMLLGEGFTFGAALMGQGAALMGQGPAVMPQGPAVMPQGPAEPHVAEKSSSDSMMGMSYPSGLFGFAAQEAEVMKQFPQAPAPPPPQIQTFAQAQRLADDITSVAHSKRVGKKQIFQPSSLPMRGFSFCASPSQAASSGGESHSLGRQSHFNTLPGQAPPSIYQRCSFGPRGLEGKGEVPGRFKWTMIFEMQHSDGCWELTTELGELINVNVDLFANEFLKNKGIQSLGVKAHADILKLVATLLVLQLMRVEKLEEGKLLRTLFCLEESYELRPERWEKVKKAVDWVCWADRQYPCVYSRLEFGWSWESSTRQLLGFEGLPTFSPLRGLNLQTTPAPLLVI